MDRSCLCSEHQGFGCSGFRDAKRPQRRFKRTEEHNGWVSVYLRGGGDAERAVRLLRRSFELATAQAERRKEMEV